MADVIPDQGQPPPAQPTSRIKKAPRLTEIDKQRLHEILKRPDVRINGKIHVNTVAKLAGLSYGQVYKFIRDDTFLRTQVGGVDVDKMVPTENQTIDMDGEIPTSVLVSNQQFEEYKALIRQNKKMLAADWTALGMTEAAGKRMEHYVTLGTAPTSQILRVTTGQLISNLELLDQVIKADCQRVLEGNIPKETKQNGEERDPQVVDREWRHTIYSGMKLQLDMFAHVHKAQALMARVMAELRKINGGTAPSIKGTFDSQATPVMPISERET